MSPMAIITQATLDTVLEHLALLFLVGALGDPAIARHAASQMIIAYNAATEEELRLAGQIISFSMQALETLGQAADASQSLIEVIGLRRDAVNLSRESHKAQRKLDQLQRARRTGVRPQPVEPPIAVPPPEPAAQPTEADHALAFVKAEHAAKEILGKDSGKTWAQRYQKRLSANRITANLAKAQARHANQTAMANAAAARTVAAQSAAAAPLV